MKVHILHTDLNKALAQSSRLVASRSQLPILANILLTATKEGLQLSATNLEIGLRMSVGGKILETGSTTVPAKNLAEFVSSLSSGTIEIETDGDKLKVSTPKSTATFAGIPATEFPVLPASDAKLKSYELASTDLAKIATEVAFAAAADESRPVLTGVQFKVVGEHLLATATDGFRMSQLKILNSKFGILNSLILPSRTILELAKLSQGTKKISMQVVENANQVIFGIEDMDLISRVMEGNFPDIAKIIPTDSSTTLTVDREEFQQAVRTASIFARENNNIINLKLQTSNISVSATAANMGEGSSEIEAEVEGEGGTIAFNCKFVLDFLGSVSSERIILKSNGPTAPGVFTPEKDDDLIHLIMPVRVQS